MVSWEELQKPREAVSAVSSQSPSSFLRHHMVTEMAMPSATGQQVLQNKAHV